MIVALDVGNSNIRLGVIRNGDVTSSRRTPTRLAATAGEVEQAIETLLTEDGAALRDLDEMVVASVVPAMTERLAAIAASRSVTLLVADASNIPMPIRVDHPARVGNDRLVNALAASRLYGAPAIVVDLGTATTFDVVGADGAFLGGAIAPGVGLGIEALAGGTAQLPRVPLRLPAHAIGRDTIEAIQSGAVLGHVGLVTELIGAMSAELAKGGAPPPKIVLTGGLSDEAWARQIPDLHAIDPLLTLRGLAILHAAVGNRESVPSA